MSKTLEIPNLDDLVVQHMHRDIPKIHAGQTMGAALNEIRGSPPQSSKIVYFYVIDQDEKLVGILPARTILVTSPEVRVDEVMVKRPVAIPSFATIFDACEFFTMYRYLAFPVVDETGKLIGMLDIQAYNAEVSRLEEKETLEATHKSYDDLFQLIGVHWDQARKGGPLEAFRFRFPWLLCNVAGGIVAAIILGLFENELDKVVELALFIPVVLALAESVAIQSVTLALEGLHHGDSSWRRLGKLLTTELMVGLALGAGTGILVGLYSYFQFGELALFGTLMIGIVGGVGLAAMFGMFIPNIMRMFQKNPQVASGPIALVCADMATLIFYLCAARLLHF